MFILLTNSLSAHQLPLARELVARQGTENFRYFYTEQALQGGNQEVSAAEPWIERVAAGDLENDKRLLNAETVLVGGLRPLALMTRRLSAGRRTLYMTERWFKPISVGPLLLPGWLRLWHPGYRKMARQFAKMFESPAYRFLPIGPWAEHDMRLLCRKFGITIAESQIIPWGYFVAPSVAAAPKPETQNPQPIPLRILWVGRPLKWKRVNTIEAAVMRLKADGVPIVFDAFSKLTLDQVRTEMRQHDVYVLASDAREGWGAALSEAMEEGMLCLGTNEAGASAALLPPSHRFAAGDTQRLVDLLRQCAKSRLERVAIPAAYTVHGAADVLRQMT